MTIPCTEQEKIDQINTNVEKLLHIIQGNGDYGLVTKVALHRQTLKRHNWIHVIILGTLIASNIKLWFF